MMEARDLTMSLSRGAALERGVVVETEPTLTVDTDEAGVVRAERLEGVSVRAGDRVLLGFDGKGAALVLGRLEGPRLRAVADDAEPPCRVFDGACAVVERAGGDDGERLVLRDGESRVLFEYIPGSKRCVLHAPSGDLVFRAGAGRIELEAAEGIRMQGGPFVEVEAEAVRTSSDEVEVTAAEARVTVDVVRGVYRRVRQRVDILETTAGRIMERAKESYRDVESLAQTRAGRIRLVAAKTFHVLGERTLLKAHKDVKIKGDTIHLG